MPQLNATAHKLLDCAERFTQSQGFNAFSYRDLQNEVGVKTSSIHYHFPTKHDLALSMAERYTERFNTSLASIADEHRDGVKRLERLGQLYVNVVRNGQFCLCGMLASDMLTLPDEVIRKVGDFFMLVENWIGVAVELGIEQKRIDASVSPTGFARELLSILEGGMLIARAKSDPRYLEQTISSALATITR